MILGVLCDIAWHVHEELSTCIYACEKHKNFLLRNMPLSKNAVQFLMTHKTSRCFRKVLFWILEQSALWSTILQVAHISSTSTMAKYVVHLCSSMHSAPKHVINNTDTAHRRRWRVVLRPPSDNKQRLLWALWSALIPCQQMC